MLKEQERTQRINEVSNLPLRKLSSLHERLSPWDQDITAIENLDHNFTISKFKNHNDQDIIQRKEQYVQNQRDHQQQLHPQRLPRYPRKKQKDHQENIQDHHRNNGLLRDFLQFCVVENSPKNQRRQTDGDEELIIKMKKNRSLDEQTSNKLLSYGNSKNIHRKIQQISKSRSVKPQNCPQNSFEAYIEPKRGFNTEGDGQEKREKSNYVLPAMPGRGYQQNNETNESQNSYYKDDRIYLEQTTTGNETTMMTETDLNNERQDNLIPSAMVNHTNLFQTLPNDISVDRAKTSESNQRNSSCHNLLSIQVKSKPKQKEIVNELVTCAQTLPLTIGTQNGSMQCQQDNQNKPERLNNRINRASSQCSKTCENDGNRKQTMNKENLENWRRKKINKTEIMNSEMSDSSFNFVRKANDLTKEQISSQQPQLADDLLIKDSETAQIVKLTQNHIRISRFRNVNAGKNNGSNSRNNGVLKEIILNNISENSTLENNKLKQINPILKLECQQQQQKQQQLQLRHKSQIEKPCLKSKLQNQKQQQQSSSSEAKTKQLLQLCQMHSLKSNCDHVLRLTEYPLGIAQGCISEKQLSKILMLKKQKQKEAQIEKEFLLNIEDLPESYLRKDICSKVPITFELINYQDIVPTNGESAENINSKISRKSSTYSRGSGIKEQQLSQNQSDSKTARWQGSRRESRNGTPAKVDILKEKNNENHNNITCTNESQESIMLRKRQRQQQLVCLSMLLENNLQQKQLNQAGQ